MGGERVAGLIREQEEDREGERRDERVWIAQCLAGETDAFRPLVDRYARMVHGVIGRLSPGADVDDLAQQTFLSAFEHLGQYAEGARFSTWLCQIAINKTRDHMRAARRRPATIAFEDGDDSRVEEGPENTAVSREGGGRLETALAQLREGDRELIVLKYVLDHSYESVAQILGISIGSAKVRGLRARERLRKILNRNEVGDAGH
ncbi:MAG: RNA polymerase sigma factor [Acidiferrobacter sp.]